MIDKKIEDFPETLCTVAWLQIHTEPDGKVFPCCYYSHDSQHNLGNWNKEKIVDIFHGEKWNKLRQDFLDGKKINAAAAGVSVDERGFIPVDQQMRTNINHVRSIWSMRNIC